MIVSLLFLAPPERFERPTPKFVAWCSIQLSQGGIQEKAQGLKSRQEWV